MAERVDLNFIAKRLDQLGNDVSNMRDDMTVLMAMVSRLEASGHIACARDESYP